jgi:ribonuclease BN (tRNA processing enzyme)
LQINHTRHIENNGRKIIMATVETPCCTSDELELLVPRLARCRRILLWGEMGVGKSTLAMELLPMLYRMTGHGQLLELDHGSPPFGVPGTICRSWWSSEGFNCGDYQALCTLNGARFRLPLILAACRLSAIADNLQADLKGQGPLLIDPPGVVRGVGGAELLTALSESLHFDAVVAIQREDKGLPLAVELGTLHGQLIPVIASAAAKRPTKVERSKHRNRLWDHFLRNSVEQVIDLDNLPVIGTPPPFEVSSAWPGRQAALLNGSGETLCLGEIVRLEGKELTARMTPCASGKPAALLVRDSGRDGAGRLATLVPIVRVQVSPRAPAEMLAPHIPATIATAPVSSHLGPAWATLVGGVFGDPLLHVRLRHRKSSLLFDLGDPSRLAAKVAHQVQCVFLSHAHLDHIGGFLWLLRSRIGPFPPCRIFGPPETINRLENFLGAITWDRIEENGPVFEVAEIKGDTLLRARLKPGKAIHRLQDQPILAGKILTENDYTVTAAVCDHNIPSVSYSLEFHQEIKVRKERLAKAGLLPGPWLGRLKRCVTAVTPDVDIEMPDGSSRRAEELIRDLLVILPGKKLAYVTDLADTPENLRKVTELARSAHTLFCETTFTAADKDKAESTQHLTTLAAIGIARDAEVERLVPFHFSKRYERNPDVVYDELLDAAGPVRILGNFRSSRLNV